MSLPFDPTPVEVRRVPLTFYTDEDTAARVEELRTQTGLDRSLILHRIVQQALRASEPEAEPAPEPAPEDGTDRRTGERRSA